MTTLGVRYLINISVSADASGFPGIICGAGYGGAGCLGISWESKTTRTFAVVFDIVEGIQSGNLSATASGKSFGFAVIVPVLFIARTESEACNALAAELGKIIDSTAGAT